MNEMRMPKPFSVSGTRRYDFFYSRLGKRRDLALWGLPSRQEEPAARVVEVASPFRGSCGL